MSVGIIGFGAVSALGRGADAVRVASSREVTRVARDAELEAAGLRRPFCARAKLGEDERDRATVLLSIAIEDCLRSLAPAWRTKRIGLAVGTSSGGMRAFTAGRGTPMDRTYAGPVAAAVKQRFEPAAIVLAACASSAIAIGLGCAWLADDRCDVVLAGGFDAVSVFVASGFECLRATSSEHGPWPFRKQRDGLALGEGGAMLALARAPATARAWVTGFGTTCDAHHLTSPAPDGAGLARAARAACADAGTSTVDLISAHGTATPQNDAAEAKTIAALGFDAPVFAFKGTIGHTLGAAGALEALAALDALERAVAPATAGEGEVEEGVALRDRAEARASGGTRALKLASAFGGSNAALVLDLARPSDRVDNALRAVAISRAVRAGAADVAPEALAARSGYPIDRVTRADDLVRYSLAAVAALRERVGDLRGAGIIVGLGLATIETNAIFQARIARPEPRRFPYTTPNAAAGECAVAFGLTGPAFAVGGGPHGGLEALCVAADLVRAGAAERIVVVAADEAATATSALAPGTTSGAIALLVGPSGEATLREWSVAYDPRPIDALPPMHAHAALAPLVDESPSELRAEVPWGGAAHVRFEWRAGGAS